MKKFPRMIGWLIVALVLSMLLLALAPQQLPVTLYKINLIFIAGWLGYWLDRALFPYARPDRFLESQEENDLTRDDDGLNFNLSYTPPRDLLAASAMIRRALIVAAAMLAVGMGA